MSDKESYIRVFAAFILIIASIVIDSKLLLMFSLILGFTGGVTKYCTLYRIFDINKQIALEALYLKYLPKYNPEPILILDNQAQCVFKNEQASKKLNIKDFRDILDGNNPKEIIEKEQTIPITYECDDGKYYLINFKGVKKIAYIMVYTTDITKVIEAEQEIINTQKDVVYTMGAIGGETRSKETGNHVKE